MRDYDPTTGRYIQADPLGLVDGASVFNYVMQNPMRYVDPRGEAAQAAIGAVVCTGPQAVGCLIVLGCAGILGAIIYNSTDGHVIPSGECKSCESDNDDYPTDDYCQKEYNRLIVLYGVLIDAIAEGIPLSRSAIQSYISQAQAYNRVCVPRGYQALPTNLLR